MYRIINGNKGFSLIEIMTSMMLGLLVLLMVVQLFINTKDNHAQNDRISETLESGRYAMRQLATDLKSAGFLGGIIDPSTMSIDPSLAPLTAATDCGSSTENNWAYDLTTYRSIQFDFNATAVQANTDHTCISAADFVANSDVLVVKRVYNQPLDPTAAPTPLTSGTVYLRSDYNTACLWYYDTASTTNPSGTTCPTANVTDWRYLVHIYYIRNHSKPGDNIPTLCRKTLAVVGGNPTMTEQCLAEGVEHFHVMFGIDTDTPMDGIANEFVSKPAPNDLKTRAVSARIYVLARAKREDSKFKNGKQYVLGDVTLPSANSTYTDKYYRRLYSTTVLLRNPMYAATFDQ